MRLEKSFLDQTTGNLGGQRWQEVVFIAGGVLWLPLSPLSGYCPASDFQGPAMVN